MIKVIKQLLLNAIEQIDAGNSNITEDDAVMIAETISRCTIKNEGISKYSACKYLNISRATFDNLVRLGKLPEGKHVVGFNEKRWYKKDLDEYLRRIKHADKKDN